MSVKPPPKAAPQNYYSSNNYSTKLFRKAGQNYTPQSGFPKLLAKIIPESISTKWLPQSCYTSNLFPKAAPQSYSPERLPKVAPQSSYQKLLPKVLFLMLIVKAAPRSHGSSKFLFKPTVQNYSSKLLVFPKSNLLHKAPPQSGSPQLFPKIIPQSTAAKRLPRSYYAQTYSPNRFPIGILQSSFPKVAPQSCVLKLVPKAAIFQSFYSKLPRKNASQNCSYRRPPKLLSRSIPNNCSPKLLKHPLKFLPKISWNYFPQIHQYSNKIAKLLPIIISQYLLIIII